MNERYIFAKCAWRLVPLMAVLYLVNFIDRVNVGFAALTMNDDLHFTPTIFGIGAGIFFVGYVLFQVPANMVLERVGARRWICAILVAWGLISASTAFAQGPLSFYSFRFLLGVGEAGFFPGMIYYLTLWFPKTYRARFVAIFALAVPVSGIIGGPLSGFILRMAGGAAGLHGWQWLFLLEGLPAVLLGFAVLKLMPDSPQSAPWLGATEKSFIESRLAGETKYEDADRWRAFSDPRFWTMGIVGMLAAPANYGTALWLPQIVQAMGFSNFATGFVVVGPYFATALAMFAWSRSSDAKGERIWHCAIPMVVAAAGFVIAAIAQDYKIELAGLTLALIGTLSGAYGPFYSLLSSFATGKTAATGIALTNSIVIIGGAVGPLVIGLIKDYTGGYSAAMAILALWMILAAAVIVLLGRGLALQLVSSATSNSPA